MPAFDFSAFGGLFTNSIFWTLATLLTLFISFMLVLTLRKRAFFKYSSLGIIPLGEGKVQYDYRKKGAGYFGKHWTFARLLWTGSNVMRIYDGRVVHGFSSTDFQYDAYGRKCVVYVQAPLDKRMLASVQASDLKELNKQYDIKDTVFEIDKKPYVLLPSSETNFKNWEYVAELPSGDMSDALVEMITETDQEMKLKKNPLAQVIAIGIIAIVILAIFFINNQRAQVLDDRATKIGVLQNEQSLNQCKTLCREAVAGLTINPTQTTGGAP